jgi:glutamate N-acetyltransferase / amino-acid N-acetyltransferase
MPVNLKAPLAQDLLPVAGVEVGWARAGIRKPGRKDLAVLRIAEGATIGAVFTRNRFRAAPVLLAQEHLGAMAARGLDPRVLIVNTGCANAGTGEAGLRDARSSCRAAAELAHCEIEQVLPFSTGVILEPLPLAALVQGLPAAFASLGPDEWLGAAEAIMTTDTLPKGASQRFLLGGHGAVATGIAKGSGMIHPRMATMLGFIATDAAVAPGLMAALAREVADASFNRISVDGDTSTNDALVLVATGRAGLEPVLSAGDPRYLQLVSGLVDVAGRLARAIVRDGEGATKFIEISVEGARSPPEARAVAESVARSPLVKTAFFASDPNLGRILAAIGNSGVEDLDTGAVALFINELPVALGGGRHPQYREEDGQRVMREAEIRVRIELGRGSGSDTLWTCDLSHEYVSINADYRS